MLRLLYLRRQGMLQNENLVITFLNRSTNQGRKQARIFVRGHDLFRKVSSFSGAKRFLWSYFLTNKCIFFCDNGNRCLPLHVINNLPDHLYALCNTCMIVNHISNKLHCSISQIGAFACLCPPEYTGIECELPFLLCTRGYCQNGAKCIDKAGTFDCQCQQGYSGRYCEVNIDECASNPCQNNGVCISGLDKYMCKCQQGYSGKNCQINIDDCAGDPCQNNGVCVDGIQSYSCTCPAGYSGKNCEVAIDHCVGQPCANGGTCTNTPTGYKCSCMPSYYGCRCTKGRAQIFFHKQRH